MSFEDTFTERGFLMVNVTAASRAIPIEGARVTVGRSTEDGEKQIRRMLTDASGNTERISLPAPPAKNSLSPGNSDLYAKYNVRVEYDGYYTSENIGVPVFAGRTSIQPVALQTIPLGTETGAVLFDEEYEPGTLTAETEEEV